MVLSSFIMAQEEEEEEEEERQQQQQQQQQRQQDRRKGKTIISRSLCTVNKRNLLAWNPLWVIAMFTFRCSRLRR